MTEIKLDMSPPAILARAMNNYRWAMDHPEDADAKGMIRRAEKLFRSDWFAKHFAMDPEQLIFDLNRRITKMSEIELAMVHYDGDGSKPYCDLVYEALKEKRDREKAVEVLGREKLNEYIEQLEGLKEHSEDWAKHSEEGDVWHKDIEALEWVIDFIRKATAS